MTRDLNLKKGIYLFIVLFLIQCNLTYAVKSCLKKLKSEAKKNWSLSPDKEYYKAGKLAYELDSAYKPCVIGLTSKQVEKIFGKPTKTNNKPNQYIYLITPPMREGHLYCSEVYFTFNSKSIVVRTDIIHSQGGSTDN